jgi:hypothetical protein
VYDGPHATIGEKIEWEGRGREGQQTLTRCTTTNEVTIYIKRAGEALLRSKMKSSLLLLLLSLLLLHVFCLNYGFLKPQL